MEAETVSLFALRVFNRRLMLVKADFDKAGWQTYVAMRTVDRFRDGALVYEQVPTVGFLLFVRCTPAWLGEYKQNHFVDVMLYGDVPGGAPKPIPDCQMDTFIFVTSVNGGRDAEFLGDNRPLFHTGERVRVIDGIYKGVEGVVKRIRKDRKLLVAVEGVAVVALSHIPLEFIEKI